MRRLFCSIAAQADNLGDIVIRKIVIDAFVAKGYAPVVYTGRMPADFLEAFDLAEVVDQTREVRTFVKRLVFCLLKRNIDLLFAPGPTVLRDRFVPIAKRIGMLIAIACVRFSGGRVYSLGRAFRGSGIVSGFLEVASNRMFTSSTVRDEVSSRTLGAAIRFVPDMAFAHQPYGEWGLERERKQDHDRKYVAISLRNDRMVAPEDLAPLVEGARSRGLLPIFVSQVARDDEQHERLSASLGVESLLWKNRTHQEQLAAVEAMYRRSHVLLSNRLHGIILGMCHGAFPVEWYDGASEKIRVTVQPAMGSIDRVEPGMDANNQVLNQVFDYSERERGVLLRKYRQAGDLVRDYLEAAIP